MISFQDSSHFINAVSGTSEDSQLVVVTEQTQEPRESIEPDFGCVDWYLYPPVLEAVAAG